LGKAEVDQGHASLPPANIRVQHQLMDMTVRRKNTVSPY
jgi:hypothetical protein